MTDNISHNRPKVFTLLELTQSIQRAFQQWYSGTYWIRAEMNKLNHYKYSGHCYPDLLERQGGKVVAQIRATLWETDYRRINASFLQILKEPLKDGINILFLAKVAFSPLHGLSLSIIDIDPAYTLGDLEREKMETINRLKTEGIFDQNKNLELAPLPQRIAVISVETSKGLADFRKILDGNPDKFRFFMMLFPALLQGDKSPDSIMMQLARIRRVTGYFDAVAIVRGGGGEVGLASYNNYQLARTIATFPLPVFTGIGHSTNETVVEMVAHTNAITPTELADFLLGKFRNFAEPVNEARQKLSRLSFQLIGYERQQLLEEIRYFKSVSLNHINHNKIVLSGLIQQFRHHSQNYLRESDVNIKQMIYVLKTLPVLKISQQKAELSQFIGLAKKSAGSFLKEKNNELSNLEKQMQLLHPLNVLKRGYSITFYKGKSVISTENLKTGEEIETVLFSGKITSKISKIVKTGNHE